MSVAVAALAATAGLPAPAMAQGFAADLVSDRPDVSESAETVEAGRWQLEAGYGYSRDGGEAAHEIGQALLRVGLAEGWELRLGFGSWVDAGRAADGWDGGSVGVKVRLLDNWQLRPDLALLVGAATPFGDDAIADDAWQPEVKLALAWELADRVGLGVNAGWARPGSGDGRFDQAQWSAALGYAVTERLGVFGEYFGTSAEERGGSAAHAVDGGVTWLLTPDLQLDAWAGAGLSDAAPEWSAGTGIVARW